MVFLSLKCVIIGYSGVDPGDCDARIIVNSNSLHNFAEPVMVLSPEMPLSLVTVDIC